MWPQIGAIAWAQFRTMRNHLPRTNAGAVLVWVVALVWYGMYAALGVFLALELPNVSLVEIRRWVPAGLLGVFLFWQLVPLFTLSSGWSLQLNKIRIYPISDGVLFGIEVFLRITTAPEMILVLLGTFFGLVRHSGIPAGAALLLLLYIPLNLFLCLAIRELFLHSFGRNRLRELVTILLISIGVLPQFLVRTPLGARSKPYLIAVANNKLSPWHDVAALSTGSFSTIAVLLLFFWIALFYSFSRWQFAKSLKQDESFLTAPRAGPGAAERRRTSALGRFIELPSRLFSDPLAALLQKECQALLRMPRFRVIFGMACIFSVVIFVPMTLRDTQSAFVRVNFLPVVNLYGLLLLGDVLLWNFFGFDRAAVQTYFVTPVPFQTVLKAKNITAIIFIVLQTLAVWLIAALFRIPITGINISDAAAASIVVGLFFLAIGNLTSITVARPIDPAQTLRKQAGGKMQLWVLICGVGMFLLVGFAFLARYAFDSNWAFLGIALLEVGTGIIVYRIALQSAVERGTRDRERLINALSKGPAPIGVGLS